MYIKNWETIVVILLQRDNNVVHPIGGLYLCDYFLFLNKTDSLASFYLKTKKRIDQTGQQPLTMLANVVQNQDTTLRKPGYMMLGGQNKHVLR